MPPDRNAPSGTSAIMRRLTASLQQRVELVGQSRRRCLRAGSAQARRRHGARIPEAVRSGGSPCHGSVRMRAGLELVHALDRSCAAPGT